MGVIGGMQNRPQDAVRQIGPGQTLMDANPNIHGSYPTPNNSREVPGQTPNLRLAWTLGQLESLRQRSPAGGNRVGRLYELSDPGSPRVADGASFEGQPRVPNLDGGR